MMKKLPANLSSASTAKSSLKCTMNSSWMFWFQPRNHSPRARKTRKAGWPLTILRRSGRPLRRAAWIMLRFKVSRICFLGGRMFKRKAISWMIFSSPQRERLKGRREHLTSWKLTTALQVKSVVKMTTI